MKVEILFVCLGNICRSPMAQGVFQHYLMQRRPDIASQVVVDSAGTGSWHIGKEPDLRAQAATQQRGYDIGGLRAMQVSHKDFYRFDYILAMDDQNYANLKKLAPAAFSGRLEMFLNYLPNPGGVHEVPDPYYGGDEGFEEVLDLIEEASSGLLSHVVQQHFE